MAGTHTVWGLLRAVRGDLRSPGLRPLRVENRVVNPTVKTAEKTLLRYRHMCGGNGANPPRSGWETETPASRPLGWQVQNGPATEAPEPILSHWRGAAARLGQYHRPSLFGYTHQSRVGIRTVLGGGKGEGENSQRHHGCLPPRVNLRRRGWPLQGR